MQFPHRLPAYQLLSGKGLEIGALHNPAPIQDNWQIEYADALTKEQQAAAFPEIAESAMREPEYICDLDKGDLAQFSNNQFDFVILSHVIEHVANPIAVIEDIFRIVCPGGRVYIACPDKRYTFDSKRNVTSMSHLIAEYEDGVVSVTDEHYLDFLQGVSPELLERPTSEIHYHLEHVRNRREHAHVWDSAAFETLLRTSFALLDIPARQLFLLDGEQTQVEHVSVWQKELSLLNPDSPEDESAHQLPPQTNTYLEHNQALEAQIRTMQPYILELEQAIAAKNKHIMYLETTLQRMQNGKLMRLLQSLKERF